MTHFISKITWVFLLGSILTGCATIKPSMRANAFRDGEPDLDYDESVVLKASNLEKTPNVTIYAGKFPAGISLAEAGSKVVVEKEHEGEFIVLGAIETDYSANMSEAYLRNLFWTWNYDETWRKWVCWPQAPLKLITLSLWNIVPTAWPCGAKIPSEEKDRQKAHYERLKRLAAAMGGNMVMVSGKSALHVSTQMQDTGVVLHDKIHGMGSQGFAVRYVGKKKEAAKEPAKDPSKDTTRDLK